MIALIAQRPDDASAQHLLAAYDNENMPIKASDVYTKQTFDAFSTSFDMRLSRLQCKVPKLISQKFIAYGLNYINQHPTSMQKQHMVNVH